MSNFKFTPKKGILSNVNSFVKNTVATAAVSASNGLAFAQTLNKTITDGLATVDVLEEMAMANASNFFSEQLGKEVTIQDIRDGNVTELVEEANKNERIYAAKKGKYKFAKKAIKLQKKLDKLNKKFADLQSKQEEQK